MVNEFIQKIVVHERDEKGRVDTTQKVDIYFNFIGQFELPMEERRRTTEGSPLGEILKAQAEEQEKIQALKEKRQQQYLKRKAN